MTIYDKGFNANEWFVLLSLTGGLLLVFLLPKRFPKKVAWTFFVCGVYSGFFYDHSLSVEPVSFYDVNDRSLFEWMDFVSYWMYGPVAYLFFYLLDWLQVKSRYLPIYIFVWAMLAVGSEVLANYCGLFHYRQGYKLAYSLPIYFITYSLWLVLYGYYRILRKKGVSRF